MLNSKELIDTFDQVQMAKLLIGAKVRAKVDRELIDWLMAERERLSEEIKELTGFK